MAKKWKKLPNFQNHKIEKKNTDPKPPKKHMINPIWIAKTQISKTRCSQGYNRDLKPAIALLHHNQCFFFWGGWWIFTFFDLKYMILTQTKHFSERKLGSNSPDFEK
jgi:hypothetical protein